MNATGSLVIRSEKVGSQTVLSQIVQMVAQAQRSRAPMQRMADKVAGVFVVGVVSVALLTFFAWGIFGPQPGWVFGLINAVAVLIIACPCALGLATLMSIMVASGKGATTGILFRDAAAIENLRKVDVLIVDKTGTLTEGHPAFERAVGTTGYTTDEVLRLAASLDQGSEHPGDARQGRPARYRPCSRAVRGYGRKHEAKSWLRVRIQRTWRSAGGRGALSIHRVAALADDCRACDESKLRFGHFERAEVAQRQNLSSDT